MSQTREKVIRTFNKFFGEFLKDVKTISEDLRSVVKANYKVIDKNSTEHLYLFKEEFDSEFIKKISLNDVDGIATKKVAKDITIGDLSKASSTKSLFIFKYIYILSILVIVYNDMIDSIDEESSNTLFIEVTKAIVVADKGECDFDNIIDEDIKSLLIQFAQRERLDQTQQKEKADSGFSGIFDNIENSFIGNLAKEISEDINIDDLNIENPADILKMMDFSSGNNNVVTDIVKKVTSKLQDKIGSGELDQNKLINEVMGMMGKMGGGGGGGGDANPLSSLMSMMGNNPMMNEMMKNMKKGNVNLNTSALKKNSTRERLKAKFEERQKQ
jgi:hypothetical protein